MNFNLLTIWNIIKKIYNSKFTPYVIIIILIMLLLTTCQQKNKIKEDLKNQKNNISALLDSVRTYKDKNGLINYEKQILILNSKDLKNTNDKLFDELKAQYGKVSYLSNIIAEFKNIKDSVYIKSYVKTYPSGLNGILWSADTVYDDNNKRYLSGESFFSIDTNSGKLINKGTKLYSDKIKFSLTTGLVEKDKKLQIFVKSLYPGFEVSDIQGAVITDNPLLKKYGKRHWFSGFSFGISTTIGYDILHFTPSVMIGPSLTYNIYNW